MAAVPQKFCLKWNDFQSIVISMFDNLRHDEELVDVTLCCDGKKIKAHRMVLSACSPYFKEVLKENPCHHPVFFMRDIPYADLSSLIEFIYTGEVNVSQTDLSSFLKTAEMLKVKGLTDNDKTTDVPPCSAPPPQAQAGSRPSGQPAVADRRSAAGGQAEKRPVPAGAPAVSAFRSDPQAPASKRSRADRPPSPTGPLAASESPGQLPGGQALAELAESFPAAPSADPVVQVARYETSLVKTEAVAFEDGGDFEASLEREGAYDDASLDHSLLEFKAVADRDQLTTSQGNSESLSGMFFGEDPAGETACKLLGA